MHNLADLTLNNNKIQTIQFPLSMQPNCLIIDRFSFCFVLKETNGLTICQHYTGVSVAFLNGFGLMMMMMIFFLRRRLLFSFLIPFLRQCNQYHATWHAQTHTYKQNAMHRIKVKSKHKHYYVIVINGISYFTLQTHHIETIQHEEKKRRIPGADLKYRLLFVFKTNSTIDQKLYQYLHCFGYEKSAFATCCTLRGTHHKPIDSMH